MEKTIFTKIIDREIPGVFIYEDEQCVVLMDKFPSTPGQALVISKQQVDYLFDLPDENYQHLWEVTKRLAFAMDTALQPRRVCTVVEGFEVPHAHIRVYPVPEGKPLDITGGSMAEDAILTEFAEKIKAGF